MNHKTKCYVLLNVESLGNTKNIETSIQIASVDYSSFMDAYVKVKEVEIEFDLPEGVIEMGVQSLEKQLSKMRAESFRKEQELVDAIAGLRFLAAPRDGDLMDDRDLVMEREDKRGNRLGDEADDAEFDEIPF